ncbi:MAG: ABC transporter permease subunit [Streptosporangiales bacterium]|nr:ABC transporter permease subunit [Streptosporangiales bacterium]
MAAQQVEGEAAAETAPKRARQPSPAKRKVLNGLAPVVVGAVVLVVWQLVGASVSPMAMSYPTAVLEEAGVLISDGSLAEGFLSSIQSFVPAYVLAVVVGVPVGLVLGRYRLMEAGFGPYVTAGYATPLVALIPLFIVWFGTGLVVKIAVVFTLTIFPIIINTWRGVQAVPGTLIEVGSSFGASQSEIMRKIIIPGTLPHIMTGLRLAVGRAVIGIVIAEFFTAVSGLGGIIINAGNSFDTARMFVPVIVVLLLGVVLTWLVGLAERKLAPWHAAMSGRR